LSGECVLLTGAGGLVVGDVLRLLLARSGPADRFVALLHAGGARRPGRGGGRLPSFPSSPRLEVCAGDVAAADLGLSPERYRSLRRRVTAVLHGAAVTRFSVDRATAQATNVEGTRHVLQFAAGAPRLRRFAALSTVFVAGRRSGPVYEHELQHDAGFVNEYERSKYEAERLVRGTDLPWSVYRLSTVVGDAATGRVRQWNAIHQAIALYYLGLAPMVPACAGAPVDLIPDGFAAAAVAHLFGHAAPGQTYHLCAGAGKSLTLAELLDATAQAFGEAAPAWKARAVEPPALVDGATFELFGRAAHEAGNRTFIQVFEAMRCFAPQLLYPKQFDCAAAGAALDGPGLAAPPLETYVRRVVRYCVRTSWGRRDRAAGAPLEPGPPPGGPRWCA
jgi:long-chain acyl-CoA synthetase